MGINQRGNMKCMKLYIKNNSYSKQLYSKIFHYVLNFIKSQMCLSMILKHVFANFASTLFTISTFDIDFETI